MKTDAHIHILPGMDTGPREPWEAARIFNASYDAGIRTFVATPHYFCDRESIPEFLLRRRSSFLRLVSEVGGRIYRVLFLSSAEVMLTEGVSLLSDLPLLTIPGTNYLPVDFPPSDRIPDAVMRELAYIVQKRHLCPLFCHIERHYEFFKKDAFENQLLSFTHGAFCLSAQVFPNAELSAALIRALNNRKLFLMCSNGHGLRHREASLAPREALSGYSAYAYRRIAADTDNFFLELRQKLKPRLTFS